MLLSLLFSHACLLIKPHKQNNHPTSDISLSQVFFLNIQVHKTMPLKQTLDDEFLSLLSTQREILKRLKREKSCVVNEGDGLIPIKQTGESKKAFTSSSPKHGLFTDVSDPLYLMNEPIIEGRLSQDGSLHKAKSRRIPSFDILSTYTTQPSNNFINVMRKNKRKKTTSENMFQMDSSTSGRTSDRHRSLYGMLANTLAFDVDSSTSRNPTSIDLRNIDQSGNSVLVKVPKEGCKRKRCFDRNVDLATLRGEFVNFVVAMEKSMKSQQDIHDWDRKMGLKRSHSKTMRLSMRSRDKLRKAINA